MHKLIAAVAAVAVLAPAAAHADPTPAVAGGVYVKRVSSKPAGPAITVTLSNGKRDQLSPCVYEDGRHCYWIGSSMGNGIGRDFLVMSGTVFSVDLAWTVGR